MAKNIDTEELKKLQMDILEAFQRYCEENSLKYSLAGGSLIGAVRHRGFIPWDDDIDIYMLRADYDRFVNGFPKAFEGRYEVGALETDPKWDRMFAKVFDNRTVLVENRRDAVETGVNIDVFPIDDVPADDAQWRRYNRRRSLFCKLYLMKDRILFDKSRVWWKTVLLIPVKIALLPWSKRTMAEKMDKLARKWDGCGSGMVYNCSLGLFANGPFRKSLFDDIIDIPFEDRTFKCFAGYDECLTAAFGDYMQLPPVEKRVSHHKFKAWYKD